MRCPNKIRNPWDGDERDPNYSLAGGDSLTHPLPFHFDPQKEVQMVPVPNHLMRLTCFLTKSATKQIFGILALERRGWITI